MRTFVVKVVARCALQIRGPSRWRSWFRQFLQTTIRAHEKITKHALHEVDTMLLEKASAGLGRNNAYSGKRGWRRDRHRYGSYISTQLAHVGGAGDSEREALAKLCELQRRRLYRATTTGRYMQIDALDNDTMQLDSRERAAQTTERRALAE